MSAVLLIDAGTGNLRSVQKSLESIGAHVTRTDDPHAVRRILPGQKLILPGVGAFGDFMSGLQTRELDDAVKEVVSRGVQMLGICVGMQALFESGEENGMHTGLGLLKGPVVRFADTLSVKVPQTGWNQLIVKDAAPLFRQVGDGDHVYFNHSYYCQPQDPSDVIASTGYGVTFACAVRRGNIYGVQFHPEKSQTVGLRILKNFLEAL